LIRNQCLAIVADGYPRPGCSAVRRDSGPRFQAQPAPQFHLSGNPGRPPRPHDYDAKHDPAPGCLNAQNTNTTSTRQGTKARGGTPGLGHRLRIQGVWIRPGGHPCVEVAMSRPLIFLCRYAVVSHQYNLLISISDRQNSRHFFVFLPKPFCSAFLLPRIKNSSAPPCCL